MNPIVASLAKIKVRQKREGTIEKAVLDLSHVKRESVRLSSQLCIVEEKLPSAWKFPVCVCVGPRRQEELKDKRERNADYHGKTARTCCAFERTRRSFEHVWISFFFWMKADVCKNAAALLWTFWLTNFGEDLTLNKWKFFFSFNPDYF